MNLNRFLVAPSTVDFPKGNLLLIKLRGLKFRLGYRIICPPSMRPAAITVARQLLRDEMKASLKSSDPLEARHQNILKCIGSPWFADIRRQEAKINTSGGESLVEVRLQTRTFLNPLAPDLLKKLQLSYLLVPSTDTHTATFLCERRHGPR